MHTLILRRCQYSYMGVTHTDKQMPYERDSQGRVIETYPPSAVHNALATIGPAGTREVADKLGSSYETAYHKLRGLEDAGRVTSRKVANARLWQVIDE